MSVMDPNWCMSALLFVDGHGGSALQVRSRNYGRPSKPTGIVSVWRRTSRFDREGSEQFFFHDQEYGSFEAAVEAWKAAGSRHSDDEMPRNPGQYVGQFFSPVWPVVGGAILVLGGCSFGMLEWFGSSIADAMFAFTPAWAGSDVGRRIGVR
jgi:hypothetical protein